MANKNHFQQGDVLLEKIDSKIEKKLTLVSESPQVVLAEGEVTGHHHVAYPKIDPALFQGKNAPKIRFLKDAEGNTFISTDNPITVVHEEHGVIEVPAGLFSLRKVNEFDYIEESVKKVQD